MATGNLHKKLSGNVREERMSARRKEEEENEKEEENTQKEDEEDEKQEEEEAGRKQEPPEHIPEAVEDFLRNFLRRAGLSRTLDRFEAEWYSSSGSGYVRELLSESPRTGPVFIPDAVTHTQLLRSRLDAVRGDTERLRQEVLSAGEELLRTQRERDFHRLRYRQVAEEKNRLIEDLKRLKKHVESYEPALRQLDHKYQAAVRQKTLIRLEKERVQNTDARPSQEKPRSSREISDKPSGSTSAHQRHPDDSVFPVCSGPRDVPLPRATCPGRASPGSFRLTCSIRAHQLPVSCIHLHPQKPLLASASDDRSWRLWRLPAGGEKVGQMMLTGEGHSDWLSGCSFHPDGTKLATTSGDATVRLWDFSRGCCVLMLSGHGQPTWGCSFHSCGDFLASCSSDRTAKLWDLNSQHCRLTLRRHAASVNSVRFLPSSNLLLTSSADRTLALWDARLGLCTAAFHGHQHPCNHATFDPTGLAVASCDSRGVVNLWDIRKPEAALATVDAGPLAANQVAFSPSGEMILVASNDGLVRVVQVDSCAVSSLEGHGDAVQSVTFDHKGETVMSAGSDGLINIWSWCENEKGSE